MTVAEWQKLLKINPFDLEKPVYLGQFRTMFHIPIYVLREQPCIDDQKKCQYVIMLSVGGNLPRILSYAPSDEDVAKSVVARCNGTANAGDVWSYHSVQTDNDPNTYQNNPKMRIYPS